MKKKQIALVGSTIPARENYVIALQAAGFYVKELLSYEQAQQHFDRELPNLALLTIGPEPDKENVFHLCRTLRERSVTLPIVLLASLDDDVDRISCYRLGGDDYMSSDKSARLLTVRLWSLLDRLSGLTRAATNSDEPNPQRSFGQLTVNRGLGKVTWAGRSVGLSMTQLQLVDALAQANGDIRSNRELMSAAGIHVQPNTVTAQISRIRRKFKNVDNRFAAIDSVHGRGYRWVRS